MFTSASNRENEGVVRSASPPSQLSSRNLFGEDEDSVETSNCFSGPSSFLNTHKWLIVFILIVVIVLIILPLVSSIPATIVYLFAGITLFVGILVYTACHARKSEI